VVLRGGSGTRLRPLSREIYPKQFPRLAGEESLLQQTVQRLKGLESISPALPICNKLSRFVVTVDLKIVNFAGRVK
jgi:mannose-1-phosphate guanylyltransferase